MRIWDVSPGYLNGPSLLGEHRELHGLVSILVNGKIGYSRHPETLRWGGRLAALVRRHDLLAAEMRVRGYADRTPLNAPGAVRWPRSFVTAPADQYSLLRSKYLGRPPGRIPLPRTPQTLWAHHKYSVMARDPEAYRTVGARVARMRRGTPLAPLADDLVMALRRVPSASRLANALEHMWGHVSTSATADDKTVARGSAAGLLLKTRELAVRLHEPYLMASTALSDLAVFVLPESE